MARQNITDKQVCEAYAESKRQRDAAGLTGTYEWTESILERATGQCTKVCYRAMERASDREYIEYGTSLHSGWLTADGKKLLNME